MVAPSVGLVSLSSRGLRPRRRLGLLAALVATLFYCLGTLSAPSPTAVAAPPSATPDSSLRTASATSPRQVERVESILRHGCQDVLFIGARGSGETTEQHPFGMGDHVGVAFTNWVAQIHSRRVGYWPVSYPAHDVKLLAGRTGTYFDGLTRGVKKVQEAWTHRAAMCPNEKYVFAGYSQGAMVMHRALHVGVPNAGERVIGVLLVGDGDRRSGESSINPGTAASVDGITWRFPNTAGSRRDAKASDVPSWAADGRWISHCNTKDVVCDPAISSACLAAGSPHPAPALVCAFEQAKGVKVHLAYETDPAWLSASRAMGERTMEVSAASPALSASVEGPFDVEGRQFTAQVTASGGVEPYRYELVDTSLRGVQLSPAGQLTGMVPDGYREGGRRQFTVRVQVIDAAGQPLLLKHVYKFGDGPGEVTAFELALPDQRDYWSMTPSAKGGWLQFHSRCCDSASTSWSWVHNDGRRVVFDRVRSSLVFPLGEASLSDGSVVVIGQGEGFAPSPTTIHLARIGPTGLLSSTVIETVGEVWVSSAVWQGSDGFVYLHTPHELRRLHPGSLEVLSTLYLDEHNLHEAFGGPGHAVYIDGGVIYRIPYTVFDDEVPSAFVQKDHSDGELQYLGRRALGVDGAIVEATHREDYDVPCDRAGISYQAPYESRRYLSFESVPWQGAECEAVAVRSLGGHRAVVQMLFDVPVLVFVDFKASSPFTVVRFAGGSALQFDVDSAGRVHALESAAEPCPGLGGREVVCASTTHSVLDGDGTFLQQQVLRDIEVPDDDESHYYVDVQPGAGVIGAKAIRHLSDGGTRRVFTVTPALSDVP